MLYVIIRVFFSKCCKSHVVLCAALTSLTSEKMRRNIFVHSEYNRLQIWLFDHSQYYHQIVSSSETNDSLCILQLLQLWLFWRNFELENVFKQDDIYVWIIRKSWLEGTSGHCLIKPPAHSRISYEVRPVYSGFLQSRLENLQRWRCICVGGGGGGIFICTHTYMYTYININVCIYMYTF